MFVTLHQSAESNTTAHVKDKRACCRTVPRDSVKHSINAVVVPPVAILVPVLSAPHFHNKGIVAGKPGNRYKLRSMPIKVI